MSLAQHIVIRPADNRALFTDIRCRRAFTQAVVRIGRSFAVVAWGAGDNHGHMLAMNARDDAGELARRVEVSLTLHLELSVGFGPVSIKPVDDQSHFYRTLPYVMTQHERHGLDCDPFHEGSSLPDAAGLRLLAPDLPSFLQRVAPRLDASHLLGPFGPRPSDAARLADAAAAVVGRVDLRGHGGGVRLARRAVVELAPEATPAELKEVLCCSQRTLGRLRRMPPAPRPLVAAVDGQARWRNRP